ncbi:MAG: ribose-phosphate diphosphokinase [Halobacteriaceae archaeon]
MILSGAASQGLGARLAGALDEELGAVEFDEFPDGEQIVRIPDRVDGRVVVVASTVSDSAHIQLLQLQDAAREAGATEIVTVIPYLGYARQDKAFTAGEPVSVRAVARAVSTGADHVVTVNPHQSAVMEYFDVPTTTVDGAGRLAEPLPSLTDPVFLAPDENAHSVAASVRDAYGTGSVDYFEKDRDHETGTVDIHPHETAVTDRDVVIVDDIVATGSTMSEAIAHLESPRRVFVGCVHPLLAGNAWTRLARAGVETVYGTDTIESAVSSVSVAPAIAATL